MNLLARLTLDESYAYYEYRGQLISSMEAVGTVLVANGVCSLLKTSIAANISIRTNQSESYTYGKYVAILYCAFVIILYAFTTDIDNIMSIQDMLVNLTMVARQILMLPFITEANDYLTTANPPATRINMTGLVTGLIAAIVVVLFFLILLTGATAIFCKVHQTRR